MAERGWVHVGILGAARIAPAAMVRPAAAVAGARVMAVAARDPRRARAFAQRHGIARVHESYAALLADAGIDAIYNPLPNSLHGDWSIRALRAGKHVLCEKPLAQNAEEARRMTEAAAAAGRVLTEAFHYRYHPLALRMREIVASGELGEVRHVEAQFCVPFPRFRDIRYCYELGGGATMDLGCYCINLMRYLVGAEPEVTAAKGRLSSPQIDRFMEADFRFPNGTTGRMVCALFSAALLRSRARVVGTRGELRVSGPFHPQYFQRFTVLTPGGKRREHFPKTSTYTYQLAAFVKAVRGVRTAALGLSDSVANMAVIDAVYQKAGLRPRGIPFAGPSWSGERN